jgi:hypothetical protein
MKRDIERLAQTETEARRMARSGLYADFTAIHRRLEERGYIGATKIFKNRWTQAEINRLCDVYRHSETVLPLAS